jgi:hypothetical protein
MAIRLKVDDGVTWLTNKFIDYKEPRASASRKGTILQASKWNLLVNGFNASTVLVVAAIAFAVFLSLQNAFVFGALGLGLRCLTELELAAYTVPADAADERQLLRIALHALGARRPSLGATILERLNVARDDGWEENRAFVEVGSQRLVAWKNTVPIPPA